MSDDIKTISKICALYHGSKIVVRRDGESITVAALKGYGSFGHSVEEYAKKHWHEYEQAAIAVYNKAVEECAKEIEGTDDVHKELHRVIGIIAEEKLPHPRDPDVAVEAIIETFKGAILSLKKGNPDERA